MNDAMNSDERARQAYSKWATDTFPKITRQKLTWEMSFAAGYRAGQTDAFEQSRQACIHVKLAYKGQPVHDACCDAICSLATEAQATDEVKR